MRNNKVMKVNKNSRIYKNRLVDKEAILKEMIKNALLMKNRNGTDVVYFCLEGKNLNNVLVLPFDYESELKDKMVGLNDIKLPNGDVKRKHYVACIKLNDDGIEKIIDMNKLFVNSTDVTV